MLYRLEDNQPQLKGSGHYIAPTATVIGDVVLEANVSLWFGAVIRGDIDRITVGEGSNIQDASVLHADPGCPLSIGKNVTVGHKVMLHGCTIGDNSLIGINAVVLNGASVGKNCLIGACALVTENTVIPDGSLVMGCPARVVKQLSEVEQQQLRAGAEHYIEKGQLYAASLTEVVEGE